MQYVLCCVDVKAQQIEKDTTLRFENDIGKYHEKSNQYRLNVVIFVTFHSPAVARHTAPSHKQNTQRYDEYECWYSRTRTGRKKKLQRKTVVMNGAGQFTDWLWYAEMQLVQANQGGPVV